MEESWKKVVGYEDFYEVSSLGNVRSLDRVTNNGTQIRKGQVLKQKQRENGYKAVHLSVNGKTKWINVHRIVAKAFLPNPKGLMEVNHKNEIKSDNRVENLEWCDRAYNNNYGTINIRRSLSRTNSSNNSISVSQYDIYGNFIRNYISLNEAERITGIDSSQISKCCRNLKRYNTAGGYQWKFINS